MKRIPLLLLCLCTFFAHAQIINTVAGTGVSGYSGDGGPATSAMFSRPIGFTIDNACNFYISDFENHRIRRIDPSGIVTTICGTGASGFSGDGGPAAAAQISSSEKITVDAVGNIYFADFYNNRVRKINTSGIITTIAGNGTSGYSGDGGPATNAQLWLPSGVAVDAAGNVYIADEWNNRIRKVNTAGIISTIAGNGPTGYLSGGYSGDGGLATAAAINFPVGVTVTAGGDIIFADGGNHRVRQINTSGIITTVAGNGTAGYSGDGGAATLAKIRTPEGVAVDASGVIYICDAPGHRVRKVSASGIITTLAGNGTAGFSGDGGLSTAAKVNYPEGVFVDPVSSCLFICDAYNNRIRRIGECTGYVCMPFPVTCDSVFLPDSLHLCTGDTITMPTILTGTNPGYSVAWSPATGLSSSTILNPVLTAGTSGWYQVTVNAVSSGDQITNGDFIGGSTGFSSAYTLALPSSSSSASGSYAVNTNPNSYDPAWPVIGDHTTGTGKMLMVNGATTAASNFWCQAVSVTPNTDYVFSVWVALLQSPLPTIQLSINSVNIGTFTPSVVVGAWQQHQVTWNSGTATTASICMSDLSTVAMGNDFAVDDISLNPLCVTRDSIYIAINTSGNTYGHTDTTICTLAAPITLSAPTGYSSVNWNTGSTASTISVSAAGTYWAQGTSFCTMHVDTFHVAITPLSVTPVTSSVSLCAGSSVTLTSPATFTSHHWSTGATTASISVSAAGNYWVADTNISACTLKTDTFHVSNTPLAIAAITSNVTLCAGSSVTLTAPATFTSHHWSTGATTASISVSAAGNYWVADTNISTCTLATDTFHVSNSPLAITAITSNVTLCAGSSVTLTAPATFSSHDWSTGATTASISVSAFGNYWVADTNISACTLKTDTFHIAITPLSVIATARDTAICTGTSAMLTAPSIFTSPQWSTGVNGASIIIAAAGNYWVADTNSAACSLRIDTIHVANLPLPFVSLGNDTSFCAGQSVVLSSPASTGAYLWSTGNTSPAISVSAAGMYIITVTENNCRSSDTILVSLISYPFVDLGPDTVLCDGQSYILRSGNPGTVWSTGAVGGQISVSESGSYTAAVSNVCGIATDEVNIEVGACSVGVPGAFSPNGDGENDVLYARGEGIARIDFKIYNRWGQVVFSTINKNVGWTGKFNEEEQPVEIYGYVVSVTFIDGSTKTLKGNVSLLR